MPSSTDERLETLERELDSYYDVYGIRTGVFYPTRTPLAASPGDWTLPQEGEVRDASRRRCSAAAAMIRSRCGHGNVIVWSSRRRSSGT